MKPFTQLEQAIVHTIAYGDIFQYPLTVHEIKRYLIGVESTYSNIQYTLQTSDRLASLIERRGPFYILQGRIEIVQIRLARAAVAACLWPKAIRYGRLISQTPFVRMVAVTGSLAMNNTDSGADIDYLVVTQAGRLWLARGLVVLMVRLAAKLGDRICPNYFLSEQALILEDQNLYSAHELVQMVPLAGRSTYSTFRKENQWSHKYLPNAKEGPNAHVLPDDRRSWIQKIGEGLAYNSAGNLLEHWEMERKLYKFHPYTFKHPEACFGTDRCKGHTDDHEEQTLHFYYERLQTLERISI